VNLIFGSKVLSPSTGVVLNSQMDDFSIPGRANAYDLPPSEANFIRTTPNDFFNSLIHFYYLFFLCFILFFSVWHLARAGQATTLVHVAIDSVEGWRGLSDCRRIRYARFLCGVLGVVRAMERAC
jgi:hypothetical protein